MRYLMVAAAVLASVPALATEWGDVVRVSPDGRAGMAVDMAAAPDGTAHLLWVEKGPAQPGRGHASSDDLYLAAWPAAAAAPFAPVRVNAVPGEAKVSPIIRARVRVGDNGVIHVLYPANGMSPVLKKPVIDLHYARSTDGGRTFSEPRTLNSPASNDLSATSHSDAAASATFPALAVAQGKAFAFWIDSRHVSATELPSDVYVAMSPDDGVSWQADRRLFGGDVCQCCQLIAVPAADGILLSSRNVSSEGYRDPLVTRVSYGLELSPAVRIGAARWKLDGCPMKSATLATEGRRVYVAWYSEADKPPGVWVARSGDGGRSFDNGQPLHPAAEASDAPVVAAAGEQVYVAWHAKFGGTRRVYLATSSDGARTFSTPTAVSPEGEAASYPAIIATRGGALVAWQQGGGVYARRVRLQ